MTEEPNDYTRSFSELIKDFDRDRLGRIKLIKLKHMKNIDLQNPEAPSNGQTY
jgi:hypothetical protein